MSRPTITVGVDGSPASEAALLYALDEAVARHCDVSTVTVWWVGPGLPADHEAALESRRDAVADRPALQIPPPCEQLDPSVTPSNQVGTHVQARRTSTDQSVGHSTD